MSADNASVSSNTVKEQPHRLTRVEVEAPLVLARAPAEQAVIRKVLRQIGR